MPSRTVPPAWRRAFLRALAQTASVKLAAEAAGICPSTPYPLRRKNPKFAELWDKALADGRAAIANGRVPDLLSVTHPRKLTVRASKTGKTCVAYAGEDKMDDEKAGIFFAHLAATANVKMSAAKIGMSTVALYNRKRTWPAFSDQWDQAKAYAVDRLDFHLIEAATNALDPPDVLMPELIPVSFDQAIRVVQLHKSDANLRGERKRHDWRRRARDPDEIRTSILRKLDLIERHERG